MPRKFHELLDAMPQERRTRVNARADAMLAEMRLRELRRARDLSQADLADHLKTDQGNVSRLEQQTDMYISTLRRYLAALGGSLEIVAHFPGGDVRITQFGDLGRSGAK